MAYATGTTGITDIEDLIATLFTFAAANGWTQDEQDTGDMVATLHNDTNTDMVVSFRWDDTDETDLAIYQSLGWSGSNQYPHEQTDDSGNGETAVPINGDRRINFESTGPFTKYWFFAADSAPHYIHVVIEVDSGRFRHFGFGTVNKFGDWDGGEYVYGHLWAQGTPQIDTPTSASHCFGLDNGYTGQFDAATLHIENMADQGVNEKWAIFSQRAQASAGTDRAGEDRKVVCGGARGGFWGHYLSWIRYGANNALKPLMPLPIIYFDSAETPDQWQWLGHWPDVAMVNMHAFTDGQEITVGGSETWIVFPWVRKQRLLADTEESWNAGIAYKKIV